MRDINWKIMGDGFNYWRKNQLYTPIIISFKTIYVETKQWLLVLYSKYFNSLDQFLKWLETSVNIYFVTS